MPKGIGYGPGARRGNVRRTTGPVRRKAPVSRGQQSPAVERHGSTVHTKRLPSKKVNVFTAGTIQRTVTNTDTGTTVRGPKRPLRVASTTRKKFKSKLSPLQKALPGGKG